MTPEAQRIAIATSCGVITAPIEKHPTFPDTYACDERWVDLPDYLSDLDDMHEAEKVLTVGETSAYSRELQEICSAEYAKTRKGNGWNMWHATAAQRAEAFLKTRDIWEPNT